MAKMLIMGGNHYFGKKLVKRLLDDKHQVTVLNRGNRDDGFGTKVTRLICDRHDEKSLTNAIQENYDVVFDQCCFDYDQAKMACDVFEGKVKKYIFTSSISAYNQYGASLSEEDVFDPYAYNFDKKETAESNYGEAKRQAEVAFFEYAKFPVVAVRFPIVLDADDVTGRLQFHVERIKRGQPIYFKNIDSKISFISADDAAHSLNQLSRFDFSGPINTASSLPVSLRETMKIIESITGEKMKPASEQNSENTSPYNIEEDWHMNCSKLESLGVKLVPIEKVLPKMVEEIVLKMNFSG